MKFFANLFDDSQIVRLWRSRRILGEKVQKEGSFAKFHIDNKFSQLNKGGNINEQVSCTVILQCVNY